MPIYSEFVKSFQALVHDAKMPNPENGSEKPPAYKACKQEDVSESSVFKAKSEQVWKCPTDVWRKPCNMSFIFESGKRGAPDHWLAQMWVMTDDIPKLMENGFHCQETNINRKDGWITNGWSGWTKGPAKMPLLRMMTLSDTKEDRNWNAKLLIGANEIATLSHFRIANLGQDTCTRATASTELGTVYGFDVQNPAANFNAIFDDMPMTGLWPWPKKEEDAEAEEEEQSLLDAFFVETPTSL
ncbi:hypothetical protein CC79DRAFT_438765 [Sarocladium strictum]